MRHRTFRGAAVLAVAVLMASTTIALADTLPADGDLVNAGVQSTIDLGQASPGQVVERSIVFYLTCAGTSHPAVGTIFQVGLGSVVVPEDGAVTATSTTVGPVPADWPTGTQECAATPQTLASNGTSDVSLTMPTIPGTYSFTVTWVRSPNTALTKMTAMTFNVHVVGNSPPQLTVPSDMFVEAGGPSGATATFAATATDAEDDPDPTPSCLPASGSTFPIGQTTVSCTVTDGGGLSDSGTFRVTVRDTTAPTLVLPADQTAEATDAAGASVSFTTSASDVVDGSVSVDCDHASGDTFPLGTTTVACSATDTAGNPTSGSFHVTVQDTTAPNLIGMPANLTLTTDDPSGTTLTYTAPTATDAVDPAPTVGCAPMSGSTVPLGTTTVTCTATDAAGNPASASFTAAVTYVPPSTTWTATWGEPVASSGDMYITNFRRTIPIKVSMFANGVEQKGGHSALLSVVACSGGSAYETPLYWDGSRWSGHLDTGRLSGPGCYRMTVSLDGHDAGSIQLDVRGASSTAKPAASHTHPVTASASRERRINQR
jgi:hypothetical protein